MRLEMHLILQWSQGYSDAAFIKATARNLTVTHGYEN